MILKDYVEGLQQFLKNNPEAAELYAYTSRDDEELQKVVVVN